MQVTNAAHYLPENHPARERELTKEQALLFAIRPAWCVDREAGRTKKASWR